MTWADPTIVPVTDEVRPALTNAEAVSPRWVQWREHTDIDDYDERFERMAARGDHVHGEADLIAGYRPKSILDAGCGSGRIAIELHRRGFEVIGVDLDADMIEAARRKAPHMEWLVDDLARMTLRSRFALIAMPGNVMIYCRPEDRSLIVANLAGHLTADGLLIAGFSLEHGGYRLEQWDRDCAASGLTLVDRHGTWDGGPFDPSGDYHVSVHRGPA